MFLCYSLTIFPQLACIMLYKCLGLISVLSPPRRVGCISIGPCRIIVFRQNLVIFFQQVDRLGARSTRGIIKFIQNAIVFLEQVTCGLGLAIVQVGPMSHDGSRGGRLVTAVAQAGRTRKIAERNLLFASGRSRRRTSESCSSSWLAKVVVRVMVRANSAVAAFTVRLGGRSCL